MSVLRLDASVLDIGDLEDFEDITGTPLLEVFSRLRSAGLTALPIIDLKGLLWICRRREDPTYAFGDTRRITLPELMAMEFEVVDIDSVPATA